MAKKKGDDATAMAGNNAFCGEWGYRLKSSSNGGLYDGFLVVRDHTEATKVFIRHYRQGAKGRRLVEEVVGETFDGYPALIRFVLKLAGGKPRHFSGALLSDSRLAGQCIPPKPTAQKVKKAKAASQPVMQTSGDEGDDWVATRPP